MKNFYSNFKLGILGGGQLGRMLVQAAIKYNLHIRVLDPSQHAPCKDISTEFIQGSLKDYNTVFNFGKDLDLLTIEIEAVNTEALKKLEEHGVKVFPQPHIIELIQDKRLQKQFYKDNNIPTSDFVLIKNKEALLAHNDFLPAVQKLGKDGYDGRGVKKLNNPTELHEGFDAPSLLEKMVDIEKEISIIIARSESGQIKAFPAVELVYHEGQNLVDYLISPANIPLEMEKQANIIARELIDKLGMVGVLAVEMFIDKKGNLLVNEVAPRPHNSGHQTIEGNYTSQYEQHLKAILDLPLSNTKLRCPSAMINLLGEDYHNGPAFYKGLEHVFELEDVYLHLYGKKFTKPFRKMGHITILDEDRDELLDKVEELKQHVKVLSA